MRTRPTGSELLSTAQTVVRDEILPHVPSEERATVLAIQTAMRLAARRLDLGDAPSAEELEQLEAARGALRGKLLEYLPQARQYSARLAAKAIAIAKNELVYGSAPEREELDRLTRLLGEKPHLASTARDVHEGLRQLYVRLADDIRAGQADPGTPAWALTRAHLDRMTRQALNESNPAYLKARAGLVRPQ
ncbi:MAG: DUF6285 domain-containing protein [Candidatus Velthaea sp.]